MITTSAAYNAILTRRHRTEYKVVIAGHTYLKDEMFSVSINWGLFQDQVSVGCVQAKQLTVTLIPSGSIPRGAEVKFYARITDETSVSEWLDMGTFWISRRECVYDNKITLTCYDAVLKLQAQYIIDGDETGEWPRPMLDVVNEIKSRSGINIDTSSINAEYKAEWPNEMSMRDILGVVAAAHGANWIMRRDTLTMLPIWDSFDSVSLGNETKEVKRIGDPFTFDGVAVLWDGSDGFSAGNDKGDTVLLIGCQWASQEMADSIWSHINGKTFQAFRSDTTYMHPAVEVGDAVSIGGVTSQIVTMEGSLSAGYAPSIGWPGKEAEEDEYPYEGAMTRQLKSKVTLGTPYYGVTIGRKKGLEIKRTDKMSEAVFNSDVFSMRARKITDGMTPEEQLKAPMIDCIYYDALQKVYRLTGMVSIDGSLVTDNLYADEGDIVSLTVDSLLTSNKISNYITQSTREDNYIRIKDQEIRWETASVAYDKDGTTPLTEQMKNLRGQLLFWTRDISKAIVAGDHYEIDGARVTTTTTQTAWPVMVYQYNIARKAAFKFDNGSTKIPEITLGAGTGETPFNGVGKIRKEVDGLHIKYTTSKGKALEVRLLDAGYVDIPERAATKIDMTKFDSSGFSIDYKDGGSDRYSVRQNGSNLTITGPNGVPMEVLMP